MTSLEYTEYDRLTEDMEFDFIVLTSEFLLHCEHIIFGEDYPDLKYYCFHLYNDSYSSKIFQKLSYRIERLYKQIDSEQFPDLSNGFANLLIYLKEPIARENDEEYKEIIFRYWREVVIRDEVLIHNGSFRRYLKL